ncbi:MAG: GNAT family N-acetyltransferase [Cyanobacteria bacterium J06623_7]
MSSQPSAPIKLALTSAEIARCFPVIYQLRPHLHADTFVEQVEMQMQSGYQLAYLGEPLVIGVTGFHLATSLSWGKYLYVADLVVDREARSQGYGGALFAWLVEYAQQQSCQQLHLDSGVQRFAAHRFYLQQQMNISGHHFALKL